MQKVYIVSAKRTAIGGFMGSLSTMHPADYAATTLKAALDSANLKTDSIDEVIVGNILPAGLGQGVARQVSIKAGLPQKTPAYALNMACGSGMKAMMNAFSQLQLNQAEVIAAGGTESMSKAPYILPDKTRSGIKMGGFNVKDHMIDDALMDAFKPQHMGITAENIAEKYNLTRAAQDAFAAESQRRAIVAQDGGRFKDEIVPITVKERKREFVFEADEHINRKSNEETLAKLRPAFKKDGTVTAGNASGINDGASFLILASEAAIKQYNLKPLAEVIGLGQAGVDPDFMGLGPVPAIEKALDFSGLKLSEIDLIELNEAFAAQSLGVLKGLEAAHDISVADLMTKTNLNGGAIALGHPVGASGSRIVVTLLHEMMKRDVKHGLASLCIGGGMGTAVILKKMEAK